MSATTGRVRFTVDIDRAYPLEAVDRVIAALERFINEMGQIGPMPSLSVEVEDPSEQDQTEEAEA